MGRGISQSHTTHICLQELFRDVKRSQIKNSIVIMCIFATQKWEWISKQHASWLIGTRSYLNKRRIIITETLKKNMQLRYQYVLRLFDIICNFSLFIMLVQSSYFITRWFSSKISHNSSVTSKHESHSSVKIPCVVCDVFMWWVL